MTGLLRSKVLKLRTLRSTWVFAGPLTVLAGVIGVGQILARESGAVTPTLAQIGLGPTQPAWFVIIILAVLASAENSSTTPPGPHCWPPPTRTVLTATTITAAGTSAARCIDGVQPGVYRFALPVLPRRALLLRSPTARRSSPLPRNGSATTRSQASPMPKSNKS